MTTLRVVGLLSGTSVDGIDAALCEIGGAPPQLHARVVRAQTVPFAAGLRDAVLAACALGHPAVDSQALCQLNAALGEAFAAAALAVLGDEPADLIGSHGQTVWHQVEADGRVSATLQLGEPAVIAERAGLTTVSGFRARDVAAGGQGAPLVATLDWLLLRHPTAWRALLNLGGIANITFLPPQSHAQAVPIAFDTGPANSLIDAAVSVLSGGQQAYDADGAWAARGNVDAAWLDALLAHPYYAQRPPKSTGRELFGASYAAGLVHQGRGRGLADADILATLTALTAHSVTRTVRTFAPAPPTELVLAGGGRHNSTLVNQLRVLLAPTPVAQSETLGIDGDFKEALLFAVLAHETWHGRPGSLPSVTGARHASVLGNLTPGANYTELLARTWRG